MNQEGFWRREFPCLKRQALAYLDEQTPSQFARTKALPRRLRLFKQESLEIFYSPFELVDDNIQSNKIRLFFVGITPGRQQARDSVLCYLESKVSKGRSLQKRMREEATFSGPMRANLIAMLDALDIPKLLGIKSSADLFSTHAGLAGATSLLQFPVFLKGKNYTGSNPKIRGVPILKGMIDQFLMRELTNLSESALIVPLGNAVTRELLPLRCKIPGLSERVLWDFPHPSGLNGHRKRLFEIHRSSLKRIVGKVLG